MQITPVLNGPLLLLFAVVSQAEPEPLLDAVSPVEASPVDAGVVALEAADAGVAIPKLPRGFVGIRGRVTDGRTGEPLIEATLKVVAGAKKSALTDVDGFYRLKLPPGTYELRVFYELYQGRRIQNVEVKAGEVATLNVELESDARSVQEVVVEAKADKRNESALLQERRKSAVVSDSIGAQEIARTPDSNAGEAVKRVVSATVVDGRYVFLRGLGGRYALTLLNGTLLPSPEPDEPSVPLDLFPTALVSNLNVLKTYSPDLPGSFGGGTLVIDTTTFPTEFELSGKLTVSGDTETTFRPRLADPHRSGRQRFGFADTSSGLPSAVPADGPVQVREGFTSADRLEAAKSLPNEWSPATISSAAPNVSLAAQSGNTFRLGGEKKLGVLIAGQWNRKELTRRIVTANPELVEDQIVANDRFVTEAGNVAGTTSVLANVGLQFNRDHEISALGLLINNFDASALSLEGTRLDINSSQRSTRLHPTQRQLAFTQLRGFHRLGALNETEVDWQVNYARVRRDEQDIRDFSYEDSGLGSLWSTQPGSGDRFFVELTEQSAGGTLNVGIPLRPGLKLKVGGLGQYSGREFSGRRFRYRNRGGLPLEVLQGSPEGILTDENLEANFLRFEENTRASDAYSATRNIWGGYSLVEWKPVALFRVQAGVRYEGTALQLAANSPFSVEPPSSVPDEVHRTDHDFLPAVNVTLAPWETVNVRLGYAYTVARPTFRELGPFLFYDYLRRRDVTGNPDLEETHIHHGDLRLEWFPNATEVFAAGAFYKNFVRPIEKLAAGGGGSGNQFVFANAAGANLIGGELEARTSPGRLVPALKDFRVGANLAVVWSQMVIDTMPGVNLTNQVRPLQGQSPYVVNGFVQWRREQTGTEVGVFYNVNGPRISEVGTDSVPDSYEQPFHQLDLVASQTLPMGFNLKASVSNVLDQTRFITSGKVQQWSYKPGVQFALALGWNFPNERSNSK